MKVLETLGRHQTTQQKGIFQYKRTAVGVEIDPTVGQAGSLAQNAHLVLLHQQWNDILAAIASAPNQTFRIQWSNTGNPPTQDLDALITTAVPTPHAGGPWNTSLTSYVVSVLEHEGSIELYGGPLGQGLGAPIVLRRDP